VAAIMIDGKEYDFDMLSDEAKRNINTLRFIDAEIVRLQNLIVVQQTARTVYVNILQKELAQPAK
jgi:hypothetical protein